MATAPSESPIWKEIDRAETYLVLCMYDEATSLASSIIKQLRENPVPNNEPENDCNYELIDMFQCAGMVFVQAMHLHGRTQDIMKELEILFGSVIAIPPETFVTGAILMFSEGLTSGLQERLEEFLNNWKLSGEEHYLNAEATVDPCRIPKIDVAEYLKIFQFYVMRYLATFRREIDLAVSWVQNAEIPEGKRQEFLEQLHSMNASKTATSLQDSSSDSSSAEEQKPRIKSSQDVESRLQRNGENSRLQGLCFWWFRHFNMKFRNHRLSLSNGKVFFGFVFLFACFVYRRREATLKRFVRKQAQSLKKALVDAWHLGFSYQVNPLAAVQSLPAVTHGSHH